MKAALGWLAAVLLTAFAAVPAHAQGAIAGRVTDTAGGALSGARVTISGPNGWEKTLVTGLGGDYQLPDLPPGSYHIAVRMAAFNTVEETVDIKPGETTVVRHSLALGSPSQPICLGMPGISAAADTGPGLAAASRSAVAIVHLRVQQVSELRPCPVKSVVDMVIAIDSCFRYTFARQETATAPSRLPSAFLVRNNRYAVGEEFVAFLAPSSSKDYLEPFACGTYMVPVKDGRVKWTPNGEPDVNGLAVPEFLAKVRALAGRGH